MPITLPHLYASPQDVFDLCGIEGVQLRLDDSGLATGQTVQCVLDGAAGATALSVGALQAPLLRGSVLEFLGGGMTTVVEVTLNAVAQFAATSLTVNPLSGPVLATAQAQDNGINLATAQRLVKACQYATGRVKLYCCGRYDDSQLVKSWSVNNWATYLAAKWLCSRRGQTPPKSIVDEVNERVMPEMEMVQSGKLQIEDIGTRTSDWPFITNTVVDPAYDVAKVRVEPQISEQTPTLYAQFVDWSSVFNLEY
jgi:hypothetical protein